MESQSLPESEGMVWRAESKGSYRCQIRKLPREDISRMARIPRGSIVSQYPFIALYRHVSSFQLRHPISRYVKVTCTITHLYAAREALDMNITQCP